MIVATDTVPEVTPEVVKAPAPAAKKGKNSPERETWSGAVGLLAFYSSSPPRFPGSLSGVRSYLAAVKAWSLNTEQAHATVAAGDPSWSRHCSDSSDRSGLALADYLIGSDRAAVKTDRKAWSVKPAK